MIKQLEKSRLVNAHLFKKKNYRKEMSSGNDCFEMELFDYLQKQLPEPPKYPFVQWVGGRVMEDLEEEEQKALCQTGHTQKTFLYNHCCVCAFYSSLLYIQLTISTFLKYLVFLDVLKCLMYVKSRGSKKTFCKYLFVKIHTNCWGVGGLARPLPGAVHFVFCALVQGRGVGGEGREVQISVPVCLQ